MNENISIVNHNYSSVFRKKEVRVSISLLILLVLTLIFFRNTLFLHGNYIIQGGDLIQTYYQKLFYKESLLKGELPLWNPYIYSGYPFLAHPYNGVFYPLNLLFLLMPVNVAYSWVLALHVFLAGLFMFFLVYHLAHNEWAALISACAFMFSGYTSTRIWAGHFELYTTSIWIPLVFLLFLKTIQYKSILYAMLTSVVLTIQFFAGHHQTFFFTISILLFYTLFQILSEYNLSSLTPFRYPKKEQNAIYGHKFSMQNSIRIIALLVTVGLFFVLFSSIQLLPSLELMGFSTRGSGVPFFKSAYGSFPPEHIIRFIIPDFFGDFLKTLYYGDPILGEVHWEFTYYIGIIPIILVLYSIYAGLNEKTKKVLFLATLFVFLVSGLTRLIFLQLWNIRNNPANTKSFVVLVVQFFERVYNGEISMWLIIPFFVVFFIGIIMLFLYVKQKTIDRTKSSFQNDRMILFFSLLSLIGVILAFGHYSGGLYYFLYKFIPTYDKFKWPARHLIITNFSLCVLAGYALTKVAIKNYLKAIFILIVIVDLFWYGNKYFYLKKISDFFPDRKIVEQLKIEKELSRVITFPVLKPECVFEPSRSEFQSNACIPLHLYNITGYDPFVIRRYHECTNILQSLPVNDFGDVTIRIKQLNNKNFMRLLNVRYLFMGGDFGRYQIERESVSIVANTRNGYLLMLKDFSPRFTFVRHMYATADDFVLQRKLSEHDFDPSRVVLLESSQSPPSVPVSADFIGRYTIDTINYSPNRIDLRLTNDFPGYLFLSEVYYPGWKAFINGKETKIYRSNYAFRSIFIPSAGNYKVQFRFEPASLRIGTSITLCGFILLLFISAYLSLKKLFHSN